jgi:DNA-binding LacI/PurR family transcriptional regulator
LPTPGIVLGTDMDLIAASTSDLLDYISPRRDSYYRDLVEAGRTFARILIKQLDEEPIANLQIVAEPILRERTTRYA